MSALIVLATKPFITSVTIPLEGHMRDLHTGKRLWLENGGMTWVFYHTRLHYLKAGAKHWKAYIWAPWVNPKPVLLPNRWQPWYQTLCLSLPFCQPGTLRSIISTNTTATRMTNDCFTKQDICWSHTPPPIRHKKPPSPQSELAPGDLACDRFNRSSF